MAFEPFFFSRFPLLISCLIAPHSGIKLIYSVTTFNIALLLKQLGKYIDILMGFFENLFNCQTQIKQKAKREWS